MKFGVSRPSDEIGRRDRLKICFPYGSAGSIPASGTKFSSLFLIQAPVCTAVLPGTNPE